MTDINDIINIFIQKALNKEELYSLVGTASNVDETERTCDVTPVNGSGIIYGVRLQSVLDNTNGFVQIPADGSTVIVTFMDSSSGFVSLCSEVDKIKIDTTLTQFNNGTDGMVKVETLITKINNLETQVNNIRTALTTWVVVPNDGGAALKAAAALALSALTPTTQSEIEDTTITR